MQDPLLEFDNLSISYGNVGQANYVEALRGVCASVSAGQILAVVGESGSGKSTLLRASMGLLGTRGHGGSRDYAGCSCSGDIRFSGRSIFELTPKDMQALRGAEIGMVFQDCLASMTPTRRIATQVLEMVRAHKDVNVCSNDINNSSSINNTSEIINKSCQLLADLNVDDPKRVLNSYPFELSGGLGQRVGIMMALLLEPSVLLLDEPTSALDVVSQKQVIDLLLKIKGGCNDRLDLSHGNAKVSANVNGNSNTTATSKTSKTNKYTPAMVLVTHNIGVARALSDQVVVLKDGVVEESGPTCDVLNNPKNEYTKNLLRALPHLNKNFRKQQFCKLECMNMWA